MIEWIVTSCILILIIIAVRAVLKGKLSLRLQYTLWGLVLVRLLVPVTFGHTGLSVTNLAAARSVQNTVQVIEDMGAISIPAQSFESAYHEVVQEHINQGVDVSSLQGSALEALDYEAYERMKSPWTVQDILMTVWAIGLVIAELWLLIANLHFGAKLRRSCKELPVEDCTRTVYVSAAVETPCLFGLLRPAIYVTPETAESADRLRHTIQHELTHLRHGDHIWAILRGVCLALHWYNPLVWWAASLSRRDAELACDEGTLKRLGEGERAAYGRTLIAMTCQKHGSLLLTATTMTGSKHSIKERITLIAKKPKMAICTLVAVALIAVFAVGCTFTGASPSEPSPKQSESTSENTPYVVSSGTPSTIQVSSLSGLTLTTDQTEYGSLDPQIGYSLENTTDTLYSFGPGHISIEVLQNGTWYSLACRTDLAVSVTAEGILLPAGSTHTGTERFFSYGDYAPAGTYRLVIELLPDEGGSIAAPQYLVAEFTVTGNNQHQPGPDAAPTLYHCDGLTVAMPKGYEGKLIVETGGDHGELFTFYEKASWDAGKKDGYENTGFLFSLRQVDRAYLEGYMENEYSGEQLLAMDGDRYYFYSFPTDVTFYPGEGENWDTAREAWTALQEELHDFVLEDFIARNGLTAVTNADMDYPNMPANAQDLLINFANEQTPATLELALVTEQGRTVIGKHDAWTAVNAANSASCFSRCSFTDAQHMDMTGLQITLTPLDGTWSATFWDDSGYMELSPAFGDGCYMTTPLEEDYFFPNVGSIIRTWYDETEWVAHDGDDGADTVIPDRGQGHLDAALEYCEAWEGKHLTITPGSKFCYTYVSCSVKDAPESTKFQREEGWIGENTYCYYLTTVFVPENERSLNWSMAGNTGNYTGSSPDVPEGALEYQLCGYITLEDGRWHGRIAGTGW